MSATKERMTPEEQARARLLVDAGVRDLAHLGEITGIPHVTLWRYWNGVTRTVPYTAVVAIAEALHVTPDDVHTVIAPVEATHPSQPPSRRRRGSRQHIGGYGNLLADQYEREPSPPVESPIRVLSAA